MRNTYSQYYRIVAGVLGVNRIDPSRIIRWSDICRTNEECLLHAVGGPRTVCYVMCIIITSDSA